ncbi:MAG: DUF1015 domain-containing protein, partial [Candidatus Limnocylindria bacterium]
MPHVAPFRGLHYSLDRFGAPDVPDRVRTADDAVAHPPRVADITDVVCPPYDVIDEAQRKALLARHDRNAVRLEYSAEADPHAAAASTLHAWLEDGTLERRGEPAAYYYRHATLSAPDELTVEGVVLRVRLEPWGGGIRPHEHTMPGPKADRLALLHATRTQLSPILAVYFDRSQRYHHVMGRAWEDEWRARDDDGLLHQLAAIEADDRLLGYLGRQTLFVADGHHRYETALAYQAQVRADPRWSGAAPGELAADWIMMQLVNAELTELSILPTHRLLLAADRAALEALASDPSFAATEMLPDALIEALAQREHDPQRAFGLVLPDGSGHLLVGDPAAVDERLRREPMSAAVRRLDLSALHVVIL